MLLHLEKMAEFLAEQGHWGLEVGVVAGMEDVNSCEFSPENFFL